MNDTEQEDVLNKGASFVGQHWAAIASLAYLYLVFIGMFSAYFEYDPYNINIFEFSTLEDFLLGVFKNFWVFFFGILIALYVLIFIFWIEPHFPSRQSWKKYSIMVTILFALALLIIVALKNYFKDENNIKEELTRSHPRIHINLRHGTLVGFTNNGKEEVEYYLLGTQGSYIFIVPYNKEKANTYNPIIIPVSNISALKVYKNKHPYNGYVNMQKRLKPEQAGSR